MGTINSVIDDGPWCHCGRSVMPKAGMYFCDMYDTHMFFVSPRFKLKLEVEDSTRVRVFIIFECECSSIFQKTCAEFFLEHMKSPESIRANIYPFIFYELNGTEMLFKIETKVVSLNRYHGTFRVRRIYDDSSMLSMFSLSGADLTPTKAIFVPAFSPVLSLGNLESDGVGGSSSSAINLGDDTNSLADGKDDVVAAGTGAVNVQPFHEKKHVSRMSTVGLSIEILKSDWTRVDAMIPTKRKLEEEFDGVASPSVDAKSKAKKVAMIGLSLFI